MMECYNRYELTPIFFVVFLIIIPYIIGNILLAMVYSTFQGKQKEKFKKLFLHRRYVHCSYICMYISMIYKQAKVQQ